MKLCFSKFFIFLLFPIFLLGQLESANWYFGRNAGLNFSNETAQPVYDGQLNTTEGCSTISDADGNLLFYTDGTYVFNRNHQLMPNGSNLKGNPSSTQSGIIVPFPGNANWYYIFTVGADDIASPDFPSDTNKGFNYYIVDLSLQDGLGDVLPFDDVSNKLMDLTSEKVTAVAHANNLFFWVITHFEDKFYSYLVDNNGINPTPVISPIGPFLDSRVYPVTSRGYVKTSPDGKHIAIAHLSNLGLDDIPQEIKDIYYSNYTNSQFSNAYNGYAAVYDFNDQTGQITNEIILSETGSPYGVEFSYQSRYVYITNDYHDLTDVFYPEWLSGAVIQYDLLAANIPASAISINTDFPHPIFGTFSARGALQLALDKKIYYSHSSLGYSYYDNNLLSVIHSPDTPGIDANLELDAIVLNTTENPYHYSAQGLPPFITSFFNISINFEGEIFNSGICVGNEISFSLQSNYDIFSVNWNFGDGNTSTELNPTHIYTNPGTYTITAGIDIVNGAQSISTQITIHPLPEAQNAVLTTCDFNNDGIALFNLSDANASITTQSENTISYHISYEDAELNQNPLPAAYANLANGQIIFARVSSINQCTSISELTLETNLSELKIAQNLELCDEESDAVETFPLDDVQISIEALYAENISILSYHISIFDAEMNLNPLNLNYQNISQPQTIYARVETSGCTDIVAFQLILLPVPVEEIADHLICPDGLAFIEIPANYVSYQWNGLLGSDLNQASDQPSISITNEGTYSLVLMNDLGCTFEEFFSVWVKDLPFIKEIQISNSGSATVLAEGDGPFEYSLDGVFWQTSNVFLNLVPGDYDIFIRDADGCISLKDGFGVLEIPNFISPNNDGYNDSWVIRGIANYSDVHIQIFDRYGKVFVDRINHNNSQVWDGYYLGRPMNSGSYWYIITLTDGRKYVGSLALRNYDRN